MQCIHNVIAVNIGIETERQTVNTQIRLLLQDPSHAQIVNYIVQM